MKSINVRELLYGIQNIDLKDILSICGKGYEDRIWIAWNVECVNSPWYERFRKAPNLQLEMTYEELLDYANNVFETDDGTFLALKKDVNYKGEKIEYKTIQNYSDFMVEFFDSTHIIVTTSNKLCIKQLKSKYRGSRTIRRKKDGLF